VSDSKGLLLHSECQWLYRFGRSEPRVVKQLLRSHTMFWPPLQDARHEIQKLVCPWPGKVISQLSNLKLSGTGALPTQLFWKVKSAVYLLRTVRTQRSGSTVPSSSKNSLLRRTDSDLPVYTILHSV
jgi:hypothetical protein